MYDAMANLKSTCHQ